MFMSIGVANEMSFVDESDVDIESSFVDFDPIGSSSILLPRNEALMNEVEVNIN
jgi:hypothetical protein